MLNGVKRPMASEPGATTPMILERFKMRTLGRPLYPCPMFDESGAYWVACEWDERQEANPDSQVRTNMP